MLMPAASPEFASGLRGTWQRLVYEPVVQNCYDAIAQHRNPDPWLTAKCALQFIHGDGFRRSARRFDGLVGGAQTEIEYQWLREGSIELPILMIAGYPRSGTTSLQTVVRTAFASHVPEVQSREHRYSLWEYPKHDTQAIGRLASRGPERVRVICAVREFTAAAASLIVGRGSIDAVDIRVELQKWESWFEIYAEASTITVPFEVIAELSPARMGTLLAQLTAVAAECSITESATYEQLMSKAGKGSVTNARQSNVPSTERAQALSEAKQTVVGFLGPQTCAELELRYSSVSSAHFAAGTEDPA